jgi:Arc/MetJ-type ribon-helix-helix transcriptional regulator
MKPKSGMKQTHINIPDDYLAKLDDLVRDGYFPHVSEAIRSAIRDFLEERGIFDMERFEEYKRR